LAVDRTLGARFVERVRGAGIDVTTLADVWGEQAAQRSDVDWIRWAAAHRRVAFTADESIRYLRAKRDAILSARLQVFCFPHIGIDVAEQVRRAVRLTGSMRRLATERPGPWLAVLYDDRIAVSWPTPAPSPARPASGTDR
jgi:hypothetical protein